MGKKALKQKNAAHYHGFDYLRAFFSLAVVAWHVDLFRLLYGQGYDRSLDVLAFNLMQLMAVPVFFILSFFLYARSREGQSGYFLVRLRRLLMIVFGWMALTALFGEIVFHIDSTRIFISFDSLLNFILTGGGLTPYYFLPALLWLTLIAELVWRSNKSEKPNGAAMLGGALFATLMIIGLLGLAVCTRGDYSWVTRFINPLNFLPYVFMGFFVYSVSRNTDSGLGPRAVGLLFLVGAIFFAFAEWSLLPQYPYWDFILPMYTRPSLIFGAGALLSLILSVRTAPPNWVRFVSRYSLGLYCVHPMILLLLIPTFRYRTSMEDKLVLFGLVTAGALTLAWACTKLIPASRRILT